jgi:hypothetical protein
MDHNSQRFMCFEGLLQWNHAVINQADRIEYARQNFIGDIEPCNNSRANRLNFHTECHYFAIAAYKLIEYCEWARNIGLCSSVDFSEIDGFSKLDIRDLRNMREHVCEYFMGNGHAKDRWIIETPTYTADASSVVNTMIGGRLDWVAFGNAARNLLLQLSSEPIPYHDRP